MAEIVNLRLARKAKARAGDAAKAEANRARHGASLAERRVVRDEAERLARTLDGARREED
jgi:molybdopterin-biosynthesis enzyme MoeA-like protein